jgi:N6-adenosine-specific RNA methylase IME4
VSGAPSWIHKATGAEVKSLGGFPIIYADPPWAYSDKKCNGAAEWHYRTMPIGEIAQLPVADLAARDAVLFMWGTYPLISEMLDLGRAWGFAYKSIAFQWVKRYTKSGDPFFGLGRWTRGNTEGCFLFTRGKPKRVHNGVSQLIETVEPEILDAPITRHSAKPAIVRERIHQLMGADSPSIELFAREAAPGWECWGNEVGSTVELRPAPPPTLAVPPAL